MTRPVVSITAPFICGKRLFAPFTYYIKFFIIVQFNRVFIREEDTVHTVVNYQCIFGYFDFWFFWFRLFHNQLA